MDSFAELGYAHKGFFNKESYKYYKENSKELVKVANKKKYIKMIELDLRKSSDGVIYCYHGNYFQYYISLKIPTTFSLIKRRYGVDSLKDILDVIGKDKVVFLDIKDKNITREDILNEFKGRRFKRVILGNKSYNLLSRFDKLPKNFVKIMNGNIFLFLYDFKKLALNNYKYVSVVFPFQVSEQLVKRARDNGLEVAISSLFFLSGKSYVEKLRKYNIPFVSSDFID